MAGRTGGGRGKWEDEEGVRRYLEEAKNATCPPKTEAKEFVEASDKFRNPFPKDTARVKTHLKNGKNAGILTEQINSAYPLINHRCLPLFAAFLNHKKKWGTTVEKVLYSEMGLIEFVDRLLRQRPITFFGRDDQYLLRNGEHGRGGFEKIGSDQEETKKLEEYLSYDEIKLSALICVSSYSYFINDGDRKNKGVPGKPGTFQEDGIIVGMVGARLKKKEHMEWQDCIVTKGQNLSYRGYGKPGDTPHLQHLWSRMWGQTLPLFNDVPRDQNFIPVTKNQFLNVRVYKRRMQLSAETLIAEASERAKKAGTKAYIHVVGLGLGVWRASKDQDGMFVDAWGDALKSSDTSNIAYVDFSWIDSEKCQGVGHGEKFPGTNVTLHFSKRALHDLVPPGTLLVTSYAWDGNSMPGNEYWVGKLSSTGDGAAACSSGVAELHNVHINPKVCGENLHVAGPWGVKHISEYPFQS